MSIIASIGEEELGGEKHLVVYFRGKQKALVLNKTNASYLAAAISDETDDWPGHEIVLYPTKVNFQGRWSTPSGSRCRHRLRRCRSSSRTPMPRHRSRRSGNAGQPAGQPPAPTVGKSTAEILDDEIPF